jgi:hypothetical protein
MSETGTKADASLRPASHSLGDLVDEMAARRLPPRRSYFARSGSIMRRSKRERMPSPGRFSR